MAEYRSPSGEVLNIPAEGERAITALGWTPVKSKDQPAKPKRAPKGKSTEE